MCIFTILSLAALDHHNVPLDNMVVSNNDSLNTVQETKSHPYAYLSQVLQ